MIIIIDKVYISLSYIFRGFKINFHYLDPTINITFIRGSFQELNHKNHNKVQLFVCCSVGILVQ